MGKPTLKYTGNEALGRAIATALYEEYVQQSALVSRGIPGVYARHGRGALMARMDAHGTWVVVAHQWGVKADVPHRIIRRALDVYHEHCGPFGFLVEADDVCLLIRLSYERSQKRVHVQRSKKFTR